VNAKTEKAAKAPAGRTFEERIGKKNWTVTECELDVMEDVKLWDQNPRIQTFLPHVAAHSEEELEAALERTPGYAALKKSIQQLGQMEPIYVWRADPSKKYQVLEGATRVTIKRDLHRASIGEVNEGDFATIKAKVLPPEFDAADRTVLLAAIHVRGTGVRQWSRYDQARFIHEAVVGRPSKPPVMNQKQLAEFMGKSEPWVTRLKNSFDFSLKFEEHVDDEEHGARMAKDNFSVLEEISKAKTIGAMLRDHDNRKHDDLRADVFDMVRNNVFKEYRNARFLGDLYEDKEKWEQLKTGEEHIADRLTAELRVSSSGPKAKVAALPQQIKRAIDTESVEFDEEDLALLREAASFVAGQVHQGVRQFRLNLREMTDMLAEASLADVRSLAGDELDAFNESLAYFQNLLAAHAKKAAAA
jgi:hypothetical protein